MRVRLKRVSSGNVNSGSLFVIVILLGVIALSYIVSGGDNVNSNTVIEQGIGDLIPTATPPPSNITIVIPPQNPKDLKGPVLQLNTFYATTPIPTMTPTPAASTNPGQSGTGSCNPSSPKQTPVPPCTGGPNACGSGLQVVFGINILDLSNPTQNVPYTFSLCSGMGNLIWSANLTGQEGYNYHSDYFGTNNISDSIPYFPSTFQITLPPEYSGYTIGATSNVSGNWVGSTQKPINATLTTFSGPILYPAYQKVEENIIYYISAP